MEFGSAKVCKIKIQYYRDSLPEIKYQMSFSSHSALHNWLNSNLDKSVCQMLIRYEYPETSASCIEQRQNHADELHKICVRGALSSRKVSSESAPDNRLF